MWLCLFSGRQFEDTFENAQWGKDKTNATNVTMLPPKHPIWKHIWKRTVEKNQTNAANANLHPFLQAIWGNIWKPTVEKSHSNATNVTMHLLRQALWGDIWKRTVEKNQTNAINVTLHLLRQAFWEDIWKRTVVKSQMDSSKCDFACSYPSSLRRHEEAQTTVERRTLTICNLQQTLRGLS